MEENIQCDKLAEDQYLAVAVSGDGDKAVLGKHELKFADVALAIQGLHRIAQDLLGELRG